NAHADADAVLSRLTPPEGVLSDAQQELWRVAPRGGHHVQPLASALNRQCSDTRIGVRFNGEVPPAW
ncbi:hypothetical protein ABTL88_19395, partial [Acinetobacter baumannii]